MPGAGNILANTIERVQLRHATYRLIPSHYPPIKLFENLLDADELEAAYALESLTNDQLLNEAGNIALISKEDRVTGPGTTPIMAAFTHIGIASRFTNGRYGVYYAGLDRETAITESRHSRTRFLQATNEPPQILTMRCYHCRVDGLLVDVRSNEEVHDPDRWDAGQAFGVKMKRENEWGILYRSVRHKGGECIGILRPPALVPPAVQAGHLQYRWDGKEISHVFELTEL